MQQHKLMILGGMDEFVELVKEAKARGYNTVVCDGYEDSPAKAFADKAYTIDVRDTDAIAKVCKEDGVDGIIASFSDLLAECIVNIADAAGLPCYAVPERFRYLREKPLMKGMFAELDVPTPNTVKVHKDSIAEDIKAVGFPCVVKPANGYGSRGIYILDNVKDIEERFDEIASYSSFDYILAERFINGHEFNMMNWMIDGELYTLSIADRETSSNDPTVIPYVTRCAYPSRLMDVVYEPAREIVKKVADYVGIKTGPISMQFFFDEEEGIQVCEIAGRLFGYEHELVTLSSGMSVEGLLLDQVYDHASLKEKMASHDPFFTVNSAGLYFHGDEGVIADASKAKEAVDIPEMVEAKFYYEEGDEIKHGVGAKPYVLRCYIPAEDRGALDEATEHLFSGVHMLDADGKELIYPDTMTDY